MRSGIISSISALSLAFQLHLRRFGSVSLISGTSTLFTSSPVTPQRNRTGRGHLSSDVAVVIYEVDCRY
ncbi:hypothetical protein TorRG33x02_033700 [Trema orientale]|uniref:Uncharacterized protein n=1 Tax=Trema orientale TaxID=63057 RepID=A0A2P5FSI9_TREOI|nr:hypothetical protein TorRG33x02_033700 [Trema orientale]